MSCDFAVWHRSSFLSRQEARKFYDALCDGNVQDVEPIDSIGAFLQQLTALHPQLDDLSDDRIDDVDHCPWSVAFDRSDGHVMISCVWPKADYVARLLHDLAGKHALSVYDPQIERIVQPSGKDGPVDATNLAGFSLVREGKSTLYWPSQREIRSTILGMSASSSPWFAILQSPNDSYMQAAGGGTSYTIEVRVVEDGASAFSHWVAGVAADAPKPSVLRAGGQPIQLFSHQILGPDDAVQLFTSFSNGDRRPVHYHWTDVTTRFK